MRSDKHLGKCTEVCKYNSNCICSFGLRNKVGCYLDDDVKKFSNDLYLRVKELVTIEDSKIYVDEVTSE